MIGVDFIRHCLTKCVKKILYRASTLGLAQNACDLRTPLVKGEFLCSFQIENLMPTEQRNVPASNEVNHRISSHLNIISILPYGLISNVGVAF